MEGKNVRPNGSSTDINKPVKSDLNTLAGKLHNRNAKKRDGNLPKSPSGNAASASTPIGYKNPKPWVSKNKSTDKKLQKSSFGYTGLGANRKDDHQVTDSNDPDLDLVLSETGKKQNLAHLLNMKFQFAPRETSVSSYWRATHSHGEKSRRSNYYSGRAHLNKDHYLQANCQFVVKANEDYTVYLADPDLLVPWETIEQIRIWGSEVGSCPICLHAPVAAKMTRCGHIYCWPCILHFLALSDKPSRPCPICDVCIRIQDLKSVVALEQRKFKVGDILEMKLMQRNRHSLQPQPVTRSQNTDFAASSQKPSYLGKAGEHQVFSKLLLCTPKEVVDLILHWEKYELQVQLEAEKDCPESCFIQQALELLAVRENSSSLESLSFDSTEPNMEVKNHDVSSSEIVPNLTEVLSKVSEVDVDSASSQLKSDTILSDHLKEDETLESDYTENYGLVSGATSTLASSQTCHYSVDSHHNQQQKNVFYFYQSSDGQAIYLNSINVQMLVRCYGALELCPETIQGQIVEVETLSMTEELRNRLRYLGHIPVSKQFQIMEITLTEPIVDAIIFEEFRERIDERARRRRRKDREERRRDLEIQRAEDAKWGRTKSQPIVRLDSQVHFPGFSPSSLEQDMPKMSEDVFHAESPSSLEYGEQHSGGPSFAQMLREGKNKVPTTWSSLSRKEPARNYSLTESASTLRKPGRFRNESESDVDVADYTPVPEYKDTFSSALAAAFDQAAISKGVTSKNEKKEENTKKNKKKVKQKVLFSTGMNFM